MTEKELEEYIQIVNHKFIPEIIRFADKHNIDRDSMIQHTANTLAALSELATFKDYGEEVKTWQK